MGHKKCAKIFGIVLFLLGFLGFLPDFSTNSLFLGLFEINPATNALHLLTGLILFGASRVGSRPSKILFQIFGILYGTIGVLGFGYGDQNVLVYFANNRADNALHLAIALLMLYLGFLYKKSSNSQ